MALKNRRGIPWQQLPLLRYSVPFGLAITLKPLLPAIPLYIMLSGLLTLAILSRLRYPYAYRWMTSGPIYLLAFLTALIILKHDNQSIVNENPKHVVAYQGTVVQQKVTNRGISITLKGTWAYDTIHQHWIPFEEKIWVYIKDSIPDDRTYQTIIFRKKLQAPSSPRSPYDFDFKTYLFEQDIHQIAYLEKGEWMGVVRPKNWRDQRVSQLRELFKEEQYSGLLAALVFGDRRYLPKEIQEQYAKAGAIHVLAVSGLHVGMVLLFLQMIFRIIPGFKGASGQKYSIPFQILGIWSYAGMT